MMLAILRQDDCLGPGTDWSHEVSRLQVLESRIAVEAGGEQETKQTNSRWKSANKHSPIQNMCYQHGSQHANEVLLRSFDPARHWGYSNHLRKKANLNFRELQVTTEGDLLPATSLHRGQEAWHERKPPPKPVPIIQCWVLIRAMVLIDKKFGPNYSFAPFFWWVRSNKEFWALLRNCGTTSQYAHLNFVLGPTTCNKPPGLFEGGIPHTNQDQTLIDLHTYYHIYIYILYIHKEYQNTRMRGECILKVPGSLFLHVSWTPKPLTQWPSFRAGSRR